DRVALRLVAQVIVPQRAGAAGEGEDAGGERIRERVAGCAAESRVEPRDVGAHLRIRRRRVGGQIVEELPVAALLRGAEERGADRVERARGELLVELTRVRLVAVLVAR